MARKKKVSKKSKSKKTKIVRRKAAKKSMAVQPQIKTTHSDSKSLRRMGWVFMIAGIIFMASVNGGLGIVFLGLGVIFIGAGARANS